MARKGDAVECPCGALLKLENDRVPWHKRPGTRFNCPRSGALAENWDAVAVVGGMVLRCPGCGDKGSIRNSDDQKYPLACDGCGSAGTLAEFLPGVSKKHASGRRYGS